MKKRLVFLIGITLILCFSLYLVESCQPIPEDFYKFLTLEETITHSSAVIIGEKTKDSSEKVLFPFSGPEWTEIKINKVLFGNYTLEGNLIKLDTSRPCGYPGYYSTFDEGEYLIFLGEENEFDNPFRPPSIFNKNTSKTFYGATAYKIVNNQIVDLNMSLDDFKTKYLNKSNCRGDCSVKKRTFWQKIIDWFKNIFR